MRPPRGRPAVPILHRSRAQPGVSRRGHGATLTTRTIRRAQGIGQAVVCAALFASHAAAGPVDLADPTPRWIEVRFEESPSDEPGRLDSSWSRPRAAFLEPGAAADRVQIRVPRDQIEEQLRSTGTDVVAGSFSDFRWTIDRATGHVLAAELSGRVRERIPLGLFTTRIEVEIRVEMTTRADAGFRSSRNALGIDIHDYCAPAAPRSDGCVGVPAHRFDPARGYVNAVGRLDAEAAMTEIQAFSPLGEVQFSERPLDIVDGPTPGDGTRSGT